MTKAPAADATDDAAPNEPAEPEVSTDLPDLASLESVRPAIAESGLAKLASTYWIIAAFLLVFSYVMAVIWPYPLPMLFEITMPTPQLMALLSLPVIVLARCGPNWKLGLPITVFILGLAVNALVWRAEFHLGAYVELLGYVTIPLAAAILRREGRLPSLVTLSSVALGLFVYQIGQAFAADIASRQTVGLAGNINWEACYMLVLSPWAWYAVRHWFSRLFGYPADTPSRLPVAVATVFVGILLAVILNYCDSRASYLAVAAMVVAPIYWYQAWWGRILLAVFLVLLMIVSAVLVIFFMPGKLERAIQEDVRLPLWGRTVAMAADHDWLGGGIASLISSDMSRWTGDEPLPPSGIGPGRYQEVFAPYRAASNYQNRRVAADTTIHPHNELLNVIAQIGFLPGLAWAAILLLAMSQPRGVMDWLARLSAAAGITCAMFDMPLVRAPASLAVWLVLGLALSDRLIPLPSSWSRESGITGRRVLGGAAVLILLIGGYTVVVRHLTYERHYREGRIADAIGFQLKGEAARAYFEKSIKHYQIALEAKPDELLGRYHMASVMLKRLNDAERALPELTYIIDRDPNYIHTNRLLGSAYLKTGDINRAMYHAAREVDLYSRDPVALHEWLFLLSVTDNLNAAHDVQQRADEVVPIRIKQKHTDSQAQKILRDWHEAVLQGRLNEAVDLANTLLYDDDQWLKREDPVYIDAIKDDEWARLLQRPRFGIDDGTYWHFCLELNTYLPRTGDHLADVLVGMQAVAKKVTVDPARTDFPMPHHLLRGTAGSTWSGYALAVQLAYVRGLPAALVLDADGQPIAIMVQTDREVLTCDWRGGQARRQTLAEWRQAAPRLDRIQVYFPYSACQLRNQTLARSLALYTPEIATLPDMVPTFTLAYQFQSWIGRNPSFTELRPLFSHRELDAIKAAVEEPNSTP